MMKHILFLVRVKSIYALMALAIIFPSCNDWIDIEPENALIQQEFWKTKSDVFSVLGATYESTRHSTQKSFLLGEVRADFISVDNIDLYSYQDYYSVGMNNINTRNSLAKWFNYYRTINLANTVMYYAPIVQGVDKTLTPEMLNEINAEMLFLRSLSYFYLVRIWKDVPLVLNPTISDTVNFYIAKSEEAAVLKQLEKDLKRASGLASKNSDNKGRAHKYAVQALLADVFLWHENYNQCINYCDSIINSGLFRLESKANWFKLYYPGNSLSESIFEIQYDDELVLQENLMSTIQIFNGLNVNVNSMGFENGDIRQCKNKGPAWKYMGTDETGNDAKRRSTSERDANYIYYRYADILLMKAEALAELGRFNEANSLVQQVAERGGATHIPSSSLSVFRKALLLERGREFGAEGKRWFDVLRLAKKNSFKDNQFLIDIMLSKADNAQELAVMRSKVIDTMSYYLPIHEDEILFNSSLVQNPFYDR